MHLSTNARSAALAAALLCPILVLAQASTPMSRANELSVTVVSTEGPLAGADPQLAFGPMSFTSRGAHAGHVGPDARFVVSKHVRVRVARHDAAAGRVVLQAYLTRECDRCRIRIDGVPLESSPKVIARAVRLNTLTDHTVEIEVPVSAPAGAIDAQISWQVEEL